MGESPKELVPTRTCFDLWGINMPDNNHKINIGQDDGRKMGF